VLEGVVAQDALNGRVFFWLSAGRLETLLNARLYRNQRHTVLHVDTAALLNAYLDRVQLAPYNTGSMHVPTAPNAGPVCLPTSQTTHTTSGRASGAADQ
jgi:hypothetical protein